MDNMNKEKIKLRFFLPEDYDQIFALWKSDPNIGLSDADSEEKIIKYLAHNPGGSFIALDGDKVVGTILCGHDGRRGYIHHLFVASQMRSKGIGRRLVELGLKYFVKEEIDKCHLFIFGDNDSGKQFWKALGFEERQDIDLFSRTLKKGSAGVDSCESPY